jgi:hypothetical protein
MARDVDELRAGKPSHAFDLALDPREERDLAGEVDWPAELGRRLAASLEPLSVPAAGSKVLDLPPEVEQQLQDIGYGGE